MNPIHRLLTAILPTLVFAWDYHSGHGFGDTPSSTNATLFRESAQEARASRTVPFSIGGLKFHFQVNVSQVGVHGADNINQSLTRPVSTFTLYSLLWDGDADLNATVANAEDVSEGRQARLCATMPLGLFSASVTNGYESSEEGDCSGALGKQCVDDITSSGLGGSVSDCRPTAIPKSCEKKLPPGGIGTSSVLTNDSQSSPTGFAWYTETDAAGTTEEGHALEAAVEKLHMVVFASKHHYYPVCLRIRDDHVRKGDPATGGAPSRELATSWSFITAFTLLLAVLCTA